MSNVKIMVAAHKEFPMPSNKNLYLPVLVGAKKNYVKGIDFQRDDDGENISSKNPNYNELTAVYWAWKNMKNIDAIGLVHYRRLFSSSINGRRNPITEQEVIDLLKENGVLLPRKRHYYIETNWSHYIHAHNSLPLIKLEELIEADYPDYLIAFKQVMKERSAHMFNMFIMNKKEFDSYSFFIFSVLHDLENQIDISDFSVQEARVYGYLSELLMDVWIKRNNIKYAELPWYQTGDKHLLKKGYFFLLRKFGFKKGKTHF